jgi:circadian clock protein KaiB
VVPRRKKFKFRLYIAGDTQNSASAISNLAILCKKHLLNRSETEVVDVFLEPDRALADGVFMTPTLVKLNPHPVRKIVGTLILSRRLMQCLQLGEFA